MTETQSGYHEIGPECFANPDKTVIAWQGSNYYQACDHQVTETEDGGATHCVKRVDHPGVRHEDYDGNTYDEVHGADPDKIELAIPTVGMASDGTPIQINKLDIRKAWEAFVQPTQDAREEMTDETRTVAAILRSVNAALPTVSAKEN